MSSQLFRRIIVALAVVTAIAILLYSMGMFSRRDAGKDKEPEAISRVLHVAAAADLNTTMGDVVTAFGRENPGIKVEVSYGSSGKFFAQLVNHAPFDVFFSADISYAHRLVEQHLAPAESEFRYAVGHIVLWTTVNSGKEGKSLSAATLLDPGVRKVAIANPRFAPYGRAAEAALRSLGIYDQIKDKLVLGENISQTAQFVQSRAADVGIISKSQALALGDAGRFWEIPQTAYPPIEQGGVVLAWAKDQAAAKVFRAFALGKEGQAIFLRHGFSSPEEGNPQVRFDEVEVETEHGAGRMDWGAIWLSLRLATCTTIILFVLGLPLAYWLATSRARWKFAIEAVVALPLVLPPTVLGFYILMAIGPASPIGRFYHNVSGGALPFSFQGLLIASVLYSLPFTVRPFIAGFAAVDRRLIEASWCLGVSRLATFFRVVVPLSWTGLLTGIILSFAHTLGEFGVVMMVGGNIAGVTRTVSVSIFDDVEAMRYASAGETALFLLAVSFLALSLTYALQRKVWVV